MEILNNIPKSLKILLRPIISLVRKAIQLVRKAIQIANKPKKYIGHFFYKIHTLVVEFIYHKKFPNLENDHKILKLDLSQDIIERAHNDLNNNNKINYDKKNYRYYLQNFNPEYLKDVYHAWGFDRLIYIKLFEEKLGDNIRRIYNGFNYRVENVWLYKTLCHGGKTENINTPFHTDNDPRGAIKVIIYLCEVDKQNGPFEYLLNNSKKTVLGATGTTIIFNQNKLLHSGSATLSRERIVLSFLIFPTFRKKINYLRKKPANAIFSINPLTKFS